MRQQLTNQERSTLTHALQVAAETFAADAKMWQEAQPNPLVTASGIEQMQKLFRDYEMSARELYGKLLGVGLIEFDDGEESEVR